MNLHPRLPQKNISTEPSKTQNTQRTMMSTQNSNATGSDQPPATSHRSSENENTLMSRSLTLSKYSGTANNTKSSLDRSLRSLDKSLDSVRSLDKKSFMNQSLEETIQDAYDTVQDAYDSLPDSISQVGVSAEREEDNQNVDAENEIHLDRASDTAPNDVTIENLNDGETIFLPISNMTLVKDEVYDHRNRRDERKFMQHFSDLTLAAKEKINKCWTEFNIVNEQARRIEVRNHISDLVTKELDQFRSELKQRDDEEAERLERVYGSILDKNAPNPPGHATVSSFGDNNGTMTTVGNTKIIETHTVLMPNPQEDSIDAILHTTSSSSVCGRPNFSSFNNQQSEHEHAFPSFMRPTGKDFQDDEVLELKKMNRKNAEKMAMLDALL